MKTNHYTSLEASKVIHAALPEFETERSQPHWVLQKKTGNYTLITYPTVDDAVPALTLADVLLAIEELGKVRGWVEELKICVGCGVSCSDEEITPYNKHRGKYNGQRLTGCDSDVETYHGGVVEVECLKLTSLYLTNHDLSHDTVTKWLINLFGNK